MKIAHLYYDLMNLYGENGNVLALHKHLLDNSIDSEIHFLTIDDKIDFNKYDIFYIGSGSNSSKYLVLNNILKYKKDIKKAIENNKLFIITGNAVELFGKYIEEYDSKQIKALGIFNYYSKQLPDFRIVGEQVYTTSLIKYPVIGFNNRNTVLENINNNFFDVKTGTGSKINSNKEGFIYKNFYSTYLLGPLLVRNPYLTDYILSKYLNNDFKINKTFEYTAYKENIKDLNK